MRITHSRFNNGKPVRKGQDCNRIVTSCWSYDSETRILRYGATVFVKDDSKTFWNKQLHRDTAEKRYEQSPVLVKLIPTTDFTRFAKGPRNVAIDWHIATEFIFRFHPFDISENKHVNDYIIDDDFNYKFSYLKCTQRELKYTQEEVDNLLIRCEKLENDNAYDGWACLLANTVLVMACYYYLI